MLLSIAIGEVCDFATHVAITEVQPFFFLRQTIDIICQRHVLDLHDKWHVVGIDTTKETDVSFELAANKPGCSFSYSLDGGIARAVVGAGSLSDKIASRIVTAGVLPAAAWARTSLNVVYQSSRGAGVVFRSTLLRRVKDGGAAVAEAKTLEEVVADSVTRQGQLTLTNLVRGETYELTVDVQSGQATMVVEIVVGGSMGGSKNNIGGEVWNTFLWTNTKPVTAFNSAMFVFGCSGGEKANTHYIYEHAWT